MKIFSLIFDYNIAKLQQTGRPWAEKAYKNKDFIFEYSAASIATFLHYNPHLRYDILTDDVSVISDINAWWPKVKKDGILSGHDFNEKKWPGVTTAIKEFCKDNNVGYQLTGLDNNFLNSKAGSIDDWDSDEVSWVIKK